MVGRGQIRDIPEHEMNLPFPILRDNTCVNKECENRIKISFMEANRRWWLLMLRLCSLVCIACLVGASASLLMFPVIAQTPQPGASPNEVLQQFEIQDNANEILRMRVVVERQSSDIATMQGIGIGLGCILLVLQIAQIAVGKRKQQP